MMFLLGITERSLPCAVLGHVLSFLTMKEAASTSNLSTRWKHIWHSIPKLIFNVHSSSTVDFTSLVNRVLLQHSGFCFNEFGLNCEKSCDSLDVNVWINALPSCLTFNDSTFQFLCDTNSLCRELYSSTKLAVLTLDASFVMNVPSSVCLPSLKVADISEVHFLDDDSFTRFICGCPVLEELTLYKCFGEDIHTINIVSPTLTRLVLKLLPLHKVETTIKCKIVIDTPSLMYLFIENYFAEGYLMNGLHNLIEANVEISSEIETFSPSDYEAISDLLKGVSEVQSLHLSWFNLEGINSEEHFKMPKFLKLSYLELMVNLECEFLGDMLDNSPCLETLIYTEVDDNPSLNAALQYASRDFHCVAASRSLKVIRIEICDTLQSIGHMVKLFLDNANSLEKISVETKGDGELKHWLRSVGYYFLSVFKETEKLTIEYNEDKHLRRWILEYVR